MVRAAIWKKRLGMAAIIVGLVAFYLLVQFGLSRTQNASWEPVEDLPGFRRLVSDQLSNGVFDPLAGIDRPAITDVPVDALCLALFGTEQPDAVPVAYFADFFCPNCREIEQDLDSAASQGLIELNRHEFPILGPASVNAAKAYLAAELQDGGEAFRGRLSRSRFVPTEGYVRDLAETANLDADQLLSDMEAQIVRDRLQDSQLIARRMAFYATPSLVIGRSIVVGAIEQRLLLEIVEEEREFACP